MKKTKKVNLHYCLPNASGLFGPKIKATNSHPIDEMEHLGIKYEARESVPMGDCWYFYGCSNLPNKLPHYLEITDHKKDFEGTFLSGLTGVTGNVKLSTSSENPEKDIEYPLELRNKNDLASIEKKIKYVFNKGMSNLFNYIKNITEFFENDRDKIKDWERTKNKNLDNVTPLEMLLKDNDRLFDFVEKTMRVKNK